MRRMDDATRMVHVQKAVTGEADALQVLLIDRHESVLGLVRDRFGAAMRRQLDPEDIAQEVYAKAFQGITGCRFENLAAFRGWLESLTLNVLRDQHRFLRRKKRDIRREVQGPGNLSESCEQLFDRVAITDSTPSRKVGRAEAAATVLSSLARLTDDQRNVVELRFLRGQTVGEVAAHLNKSEAAIHMLCHRGLKSLREIMLSMSQFLSSSP